MAANELERLRTLAQFAEQICSLSEDGAEARHRINNLIGRAEDDIRTKSLEIQLQKSHIALLKQLDGFMNRVPAESATRISANSANNGSPRAISGEVN